MVNLTISSSTPNTYFNFSGTATIQSTNVINNFAIHTNSIFTVSTSELTINNLQLFSTLMLQLTPNVTDIYINNLTIFKSAAATEQGRINIVTNSPINITIQNVSIITDTSNYISGTLVTSAPIYFYYSLADTPNVLINGGYVQVKNTSIVSGFRLLSSNNVEDTSFAIMKDFIAYPISLGNVVSGKNTILVNTTNINHD